MVDGMSITCPSCGIGKLNLFDYTSLMVIRPELGLFSMVCPECQTKISSMQPIPPSLFDEIRSAAASVDAGMGLGIQE